MIKTVVFDFDGTLAPLTLNFDHLRKKVEEIAKKYVSAAFIRRLDGFYIIEMIYEVEKGLGETGAAFRREAFAKLRDLEVEAARGKDVFPYTREVLSLLRQSGIKLGVMTRNCSGAVKRVFPDMEVYVDAVVTRDDVAVVKPNPGHAAAVLARLAVDAGSAMLVGDHPTDILTGKVLHTFTVGVLTGRTGRGEFEKVGADRILNDIREVPSIL